MPGETCGVCQLPATQCCSGCRLVYYCGRDHQKQHWRVHKVTCQVKPYKILHSSTLGRYLIATRDIRQGETIFKERPVVIGPKMYSRPVCLGCNARITSGYTCSRCNWPLCGQQCEKSPLHAEECSLMEEQGYQTCSMDITKPNAAYCCITPLRCLLLKDKDKTKWEALTNLESHLEKRRNTTIYSILKANTLGFFRSFPRLEKVSEETILRICGILDTNCFEVCRSEGGVKVRGIYLTACIMSHDCTPNTKHVFADEDCAMSVMATVPIKQGDIISTTYTQTLWNTLARQNHLKAAKCFDCTCKRCLDPSEFGTYLGSILCSKCRNNNDGHGGKLVSTDPLNVEAIWKCDTCSYTAEAKEIEFTNSLLRKEVANLDISTPQAFEKCLQKLTGIVHPMNSHVIEIKYALSQMYGTSPGYSLSELNETLLERKEELCTELLQIADLLDPGSSHLRGSLLLERQAAMVARAKRSTNKTVKQGSGLRSQ